MNGCLCVGGFILCGFVVCVCVCVCAGRGQSTSQDEGVEPGEGGVKEGAADVDPPSTPKIGTCMPAHPPTHPPTHTHTYLVGGLSLFLKKKPCRLFQDD